MRAKYEIFIALSHKIVASSDQTQRLKKPMFFKLEIFFFFGFWFLWFLMVFFVFLGLSLESQK